MLPAGDIAEAGQPFAQGELATNHSSRKVSRSDPRPGRLRMELAESLRAAGKLRQATEAYFDIYQDGFRQPIVLAAMAVSLFQEGRLTEAILANRVAIAEDPRLFTAWSNLLYALCAVDNLDPIELFREHCSFGRLFPSPKPLARQRRRGKVRVGFLCSWFIFHPVGRFSLPVLKGLDRRRFEIYCYNSGEHSDTITQQFREAANYWREITELDDEQAGGIIRDDDLDILIEMDGHTGGNRLPVVAQKPARKIITWLGYPNTTGVPAIDYKFVDPITDPQAISGPLHVEKLFPLGPCYTIFPKPDSTPAVSSLPAAANGYVTFGAFGQVHKHSDSVLDAISRVLLAAPNSHLVIRASGCRDQTVKDVVLKRFQLRGIAAERIDCAAADGNSKYLASHRQVDVMLDMFPYNGCTTACESLWMGVPMVTLQGRTHRERVASSLLTAAGYPELVATTVNDYTEIAVRLAQDIPRLAEMRAGLRPALLASPLMDIPAFVRRFEEALLSIVQN